MAVDRTVFTRPDQWCRRWMMIRTAQPNGAVINYSPGCFKQINRARKAQNYFAGFSVLIHDMAGFHAALAWKKIKLKKTKKNSPARWRTNVQTNFSHAATRSLCIFLRGKNKKNRILNFICLRCCRRLLREIYPFSRCLQLIWGRIPLDLSKWNVNIGPTCDGN